MMRPKHILMSAIWMVSVTLCVGSAMAVVSIPVQPTEEFLQRESHLPATPADYVLTNGKIYSVNDKQPWAEALAVLGNKIVYVGDNAGAAAYIAKGVEVYDLGGKFVMPGFVEGHFHTTTQGVALWH